MTDFDSPTNKDAGFGRKPEGYLPMAFSQALVNPSTTLPELARIIDEYTSSLRDKGLIEEAKEVTRQAIARFEGPLNDRDAARPIVATQLRLTLADIKLSEGFVYEAERFLRETEALLLGRPEQASERYAVLNKLAEALMLRECFADAQAIAEEVLTWVIGSSTPEEVRALIVWAQAEYGLRHKQANPAQGAPEYAAEVVSHINDSLDVISELLEGYFPQNCPPSAPNPFVREQASNLLMIAELLLHLKATANARECCEQAETILNLAPTIPEAKRITLQALVTRAKILESDQQHEAALERYQDALHFCETGLNSPRGPAALGLRVSISEMELEAVSKMP